MNKLIEFLDNTYPSYLSFEWDNIGLQLGKGNNNYSNVLVTLDITLSVIENAIKNNINLIISHHPLIFSKLDKIDYDSKVGIILKKCILNNIDIYILHTNFDVVKNGMNDILINLFRPIKVNKFIPVNNNEYLGRFSEIKEISFHDLINKTKKIFKLDKISYTGDLSKKIRSISVIGGSGHSYWKEAKECSDVLITGDLTYHSALDAREANFCIIDIEHFSENVFKEKLVEILIEEFPKINFSLSKEDNPIKHK